MKRACCKKNCNDIGEYKYQSNYFYCPKHYCFNNMRHGAQTRRKFIPTLDECEILLFIWCLDFKCPICNIKLKWHSDTNGRSNVITIQHNNNGTIMFICQGCNAAHGASKLGDAYFRIPHDKKYCPSCDRILLKSRFSKSAKRKDKLHSMCRECDSLYQKNRYKERKLK